MFIVNHVAFFVSHRLPIALEAQRRGWKVTLLTGMPGSDSMERAAVAKLHEHGIAHQRFAFGSSTVNPLREAWGLLGLIRRLRRLRPDIVHCASPKGVIYGGIAARVARVPSLVLAVSGLGYSFTASSGAGLKRRLLAALISLVSGLAFRHWNRKVIVQNSDDLEWVRKLRLCPSADLCLIPGSGVDLGLFAVPAAGGKEELVVFPARLLRDKGVVEFISAVRQIRVQVPHWRFVLAGAADYLNPSSIPRDQVERWVEEGLVEWPGHVEDMAPLFAAASIVCLPSYREGLPKALLEAAAAGCAVITTDATGARDAVVAGITGDIVPVRDTQALAAALLALIREPARRESYGSSGKLLARENFGLDAVLAAVFDLYKVLVARA